MNTNKEEVLKIVDKICQQYAISGREYYQGFRSRWNKAFAQALEMEENGVSYLPDNPDAILTIEHSFEDFQFTFHLDQLKINNWYQKEMERKSKTVFETKKLKRSRTGVLTLDETVCEYDPELPEPLLAEKDKNIIACAFPGLPNPTLRVVYGNKWVDARFNPLRQRSLHLYIINTDYVPAFLGSPVEVVLYLFMMDCCIIKLNYKAVKDKDLKQYLHIFRPSPMLQIKGIFTGPNEK